MEKNQPPRKISKVSKEPRLTMVSVLVASSECERRDEGLACSCEMRKWRRFRSTQGGGRWGEGCGSHLLKELLCGRSSGVPLGACWCADPLKGDIDPCQACKERTLHTCGGSGSSQECLRPPQSDLPAVHVRAPPPCTYVHLLGPTGWHLSAAGHKHKIRCVCVCVCHQGNHVTQLVDQEQQLWLV